MRFLAELPWNPDALLNANGLEWRQPDDRTVEVGLPVPAGPAHVRLIFDAAGDIVRVEADDRPMAVGKASLPTKWVGRFSDYVAFGPYRLPRHGEVAWVLADGEFLYWRGDIVGVNAVLP